MGSSSSHSTRSAPDGVRERRTADGACAIAPAEGRERTQARAGEPQSHRPGHHRRINCRAASASGRDRARHGDAADGAAATSPRAISITCRGAECSPRWRPLNVRGSTLLVVPTTRRSPRDPRRRIRMRDGRWSPTSERPERPHEGRRPPAPCDRVAGPAGSKRDDADATAIGVAAVVVLTSLGEGAPALRDGGVPGPWEPTC